MLVHVLNLVRYFNRLEWVAGVMILLNLLAVGVTVELETMFVYDVTEQEDVEDEQEWGMHRTLGDALIQRKGGGQLLVERCARSHVMREQC